MVARWKNDEDHADYEWSLNKFLVDNGIVVKTGQAVDMDVPKGYGEVEKPFKVDITTEGEGDLIGPGDTIYIHYRGTLLDGTLFDFSRDTNKSEKWKNLSQNQVPPMKVEVGKTGLVEGFNKALLEMRPFSEADVLIPPSMAYKGKKTKKIPPYSYLNFHIEIINVFRAGEVDTVAEAEKAEKAGEEVVTEN